MAHVKNTKTNKKSLTTKTKDNSAEDIKINAQITKYGLQIPRNLLGKKMGVKKLQSFLRTLTVTEKIHPGKPKGIGRIVKHCYYSIGKDENASLVVPRNKAPDLLRQGIITSVQFTNTLPEPLKIPKERLGIEIEMYEYQKAAICFLCEGKQAPFSKWGFENFISDKYVEMFTGLGKTAFAFGVINHLKLKTLVVVPSSKEIGNQWITEGSAFVPKYRIALYKNPAKNSKKPPPGPETHDVVVILINTFRQKLPDFLNGFGLIVHDEAHELHSKKNSTALWLSQTRYVLGLSATPLERKDGLDRIVPIHLGPVVHQKDIPNFNVDDATFQGEVWKIEYHGHPDFCETSVSSTGSVSAMGTISNLIKDPHRLQLIANMAKYVHTLHEKPHASKYGLGKSDDDDEDAPIRRHGVYIFAEHRDFLPIMRSTLNTLFSKDEVYTPELETEQTFSIMRGGIKHEESKRIKKAKAHIILVTYGYGRRGISKREQTAMISASPRRNGQKQIMGRVLRRGSDQRIKRLFVDLVDMRSSLKSQYNDRLKVYKSMGYDIKKIKVNYKDVQLPEQTSDEPDDEVDLDNIDNLSRPEMLKLLKAAKD